MNPSDQSTDCLLTTAGANPSVSGTEEGNHLISSEDCNHSVTTPDTPKKVTPRSRSSSSPSSEDFRAGLNRADQLWSPDLSAQTLKVQETLQAEFNRKRQALVKRMLLSAGPFVIAGSFSTVFFLEAANNITHPFSTPGLLLIMSTALILSCFFARKDKVTRLAFCLTSLGIGIAIPVLGLLSWTHAAVLFGASMSMGALVSMIFAGAATSITSIVILSCKQFQEISQASPNFKNNTDPVKRNLFASPTDLQKGSQTHA
jgi:hypothetical protein